MSLYFDYIPLELHEIIISKLNINSLDNYIKLYNINKYNWANIINLKYKYFSYFNNKAIIYKIIPNYDIFFSLLKIDESDASTFLDIISNGIHIETKNDYNILAYMIARFYFEMNDIYDIFDSLSEYIFIKNYKHIYDKLIQYKIYNEIDIIKLYFYILFLNQKDTNTHTGFIINLKYYILNGIIKSDYIFNANDFSIDTMNIYYSSEKDANNIFLTLMMLEPSFKYNDSTMNILFIYFNDNNYIDDLTDFLLNLLRDKYEKYMIE